MRQLLSIICLCALAMPFIGKELHLDNPTFEDYLPLLNDAGYEVESFDISDIADSTYYIQLQIREYEAGKAGFKESGSLYATQNRRMASEYVYDTIAPDEMVDPEKGIYMLAQKLNIGLRPINDSTKAVSMDLPRMGTSVSSVIMRSLHNPLTGKDLLIPYVSRPFKVEAINTRGFTPLLWLGSFWWDDEIKSFRCCGENEISSLDSDIVASSPHYYVIGITVTPK